MNNIHNLYHSKKFFSGVLLLAGIVLAVLAPYSAVNVDEQLHYPHAKDVVNWYYTGGADQSCLNTPVTNLKYYGQSVDNLTALLNRVFNVEDEFLLRHYTGAVIFLLLLLFTGLMSREITGSWLIASLTMMALIFMPRLAGHAFGNLKDIPFAAGYMAGLLMIVRFLKELPNPRWKTALLLGTAIAFTVSVRAGGFILFAYLGLAFLIYFILKPFYFIQIVSTKPVFVRLLGQAAAIVVIGYFAGLLFWPFALQNVWAHPLESLQVMEHYKVSIRQVFEGKLMWSTQLPWVYLPKWFAISTPLFVLTGFLCYLCFFFAENIRFCQSKKQLLLEGFVLFAFVFPFIYVIVIGSNLYSGIRQMLFILPPLTILSVWGIYKLFQVLFQNYRRIYYPVFILFLMLLLLPLKHQALTFPVDYVFFNPLAGGNKKAWSNYEYDYYFHGIRQAVDYLEELNIPGTITIAMNCNLSNYFDKKNNRNYIYTRFLERSSAEWDYGIFGLNYLDPALLKASSWLPSETVKIFYHKGNPVALIVKRSDKSDFNGISEIKNGNLQLGMNLLEEAISKQKNNVWLYVHMAKAQLESNNREKFLYYLNEGKNLYSRYEPLLLLEATFYYGEMNLELANKALGRLFEINPRYLPAKPLFDKVRNEMNSLREN